MSLFGPAMKRPWTVILTGAAIVTLAMGVRQSFGLFLPQMSVDLGIGRGDFGMALAIQNLLFGLAQPLVGALGDRYGAGRVVAGGTLLYVVGMLAAAWADSALGLTLSFGILIGMALSATTFVTVLGAVGRVVPAEKRGMAFGLVTAGGSLGQFLVVPAAQMLLGDLGYRLALVVLAGLIATMIVLAIGVAGRPGAGSQQAEPAQTMRAALAEAAGHRGYWLLNAGFFVCGFHIAFIATHFPAYLSDRGLGLEVGASALALVGLFNIFGSYLAGLSADRLRKKYVLSAIYAARSVVIILFLLAPLSAASALVFAAAMGFLWLGTVPLTSGLVGQIFGVRYLSTLYGIVFLSHQVGSFFGAWAAGYAYDLSGNYDFAWAASIALGLFAAIVHLPIADRPVARLRPA
ncbi:MFS transporter [Allosphingosinicella indica]|uniref:Predicted arabinose efflux permease, MFS family n=1 Tax=Allosphingosinicella indica TaxID=941907 RepID=A0A1X7FZA6_9SPHN|nr:MFS transporter [Allosphingosinicella indica]SMF61399.1 Predicted arabinose efflux permease, MFS family [Allosphingosinicella indica]